jgi:hypothetical protein
LEQKSLNGMMVFTSADELNVVEEMVARIGIIRQWRLAGRRAGRTATAEPRDPTVAEDISGTYRTGYPVWWERKI